MTRWYHCVASDLWKKLQCPPVSNSPMWQTQCEVYPHSAGRSFRRSSSLVSSRGLVRPAPHARGGELPRSNSSVHCLCCRRDPWRRFLAFALLRHRLPPVLFLLGLFFFFEKKLFILFFKISFFQVGEEGEGGGANPNPKLVSSLGGGLCESFPVL